VLLAQKPAIDTTAINNWPNVGRGAITDNGRFVFYYIDKAPEGESLVVKSNYGKWEMTFSGISRAAFTHDSRYLIFKTGEKELDILSLGAEKIERIPDVDNFQVPDIKTINFVLYRSASSDQEIIIYNLSTGRRLFCSGVKDYLCGFGGKALLVNENRGENGRSVNCLRLLNLEEDSAKTIWKSPNKRAMAFVFSNKGVGFLVDSKDSQSRYQVWYYESGFDTAVMVGDNRSFGLQEGYDISSGGLKFSDDGQSIFVNLKRVSNVEGAGDRAIHMQVWSYKDPKIKPVQEEEAVNNSACIAVVNIRKRVVQMVLQNDERIFALSGPWAIIGKDLGRYGVFESGWNSAAQQSYRLVNLETRVSKELRHHVRNPTGGISLSPNGRWVVYYDVDKHNYFSYNVVTGKLKGITSGCHTIWIDYIKHYPEPSLAFSLSSAKWLENDRAVLIYDNYDIWKIDPEGIKAPVNITNGYGKRNHIRFSFLNDGDPSRVVNFGNSSASYVRAINLENKDRGFFKIDIRHCGDPQLLSMGPYVYGEWEGHFYYNYPPIKAANANCFLVMRMSSTEAPNYFVSTDLKLFSRVSNIAPQRKYNWLTTTLLRWRTFNGTYCSGILYKPEDFDIRKKYPVIFDYYEDRSDELNLFVRPGTSTGSINIPWFVSKGYLVFVPDIHYSIGHPGESAYNCVVSAALFLSRKAYVDSRRLGIQGHSFGGFETNYIVTHTGIFAAACSAAGFCDLISFYGSIARGSYPMFWAESIQGRLGVTPWNGEQLYLENSPVLKASAVTTPLLLMHNKGDNIVPFAQAVEFFTALRRLGKTAWLLQYDGSDHFVEGRDQSLDYTLKMTQFFNHYLRDMQIPNWMKN